MKDFFNCQECLDLLVDFLDENLEPETQKKLDEHLSACPPCLHFIKSYRSCTDMAGMLRDQRVEIPQEVQLRLKSFLKEHLGVSRS